MNQRALVALAHALVQQPMVVLIDDLTIGLGGVEREHLVSLLRNLAEDDGLGVLMTTSDQSMLTSAHRVGFLRGGRVVPAHALGGAATKRSTDAAG